MSTSSELPPTEPHIVIVGGGIIGCTTAYYLTKRLSQSSPSPSPSAPTPASPSAPTSTPTRNPPKKLKGRVTLLEPSSHGPAHGASGKAGGLVARWAYPKELVAVSYPEHERLAREHGGAERWGWRYVECGTWEGRAEVRPEGPSSQDQGEAGGRQQRNLEKELGLPGGTKPRAPKVKEKSRKDKGLPDDLTWVSEFQTDSYTPIARTGDTAQVHPYLFTTAMFDLAREAGLEFIQGRVTQVLKSNGRVVGVEYLEGVGEGVVKKEIRDATHVILAAGAWSPHIIPALPISATRAHSVTIRPAPGTHISPYVLFTEIAVTTNTLGKETTSTTVSPEIYARPDGEVYACGPGDDAPLPPTVDDVEVNSAACASLLSHVAAISPELRGGTVDKRQACFLPVVDGGAGPIVGEARDIADGLYLAVGHTCWGICNAPGTALALTELILDGKITCANLRKLQPSVVL